MKQLRDSMKTILKRLGENISAESIRAILKLLESNDTAKFLDVGCGDGKITLQAAHTIGTNKIYGIDVVGRTMEKARGNGVDVRSSDLNRQFPFEDNSFDVVLASEIIEHLYDTDNFLTEIHRVLRIGGYTIISTPNLSSWPNIIFLLFGKQPAVASVSDQIVVNTWHANSDFRTLDEGPSHRRIFTFGALQGLVEYYGLEDNIANGLGYFSQSGFISRIMARLDKYHAANMVIRAREKLAIK
jgi:methionine biosynthesis protein MetW